MARKMRSDEEVTLNLASMLDMAFQLLAFFILTFQPPPAEAQIVMRMPPPQKVVGAGTESAGEDTNKSPDDVKPVKTLTVSVASRDGGIEHIAVGVPSVAMKEITVSQSNMAATFIQLNEELDRYFKGSADAFEQVIVEASPELRYGELMRVVEICSNQHFADGTKLGKLSFVALPPFQPNP